MITIATAAAALSTSINLRHHATELRDRGYTVIPDAGISADLVKDARFAVASEFSRLLDNLEELGIDPVESSYAFKELDKRHANRWSVRPTQAESAWTRLVDSAVAAASPVVEALHAELPPSADDGLLPEFTSPMARSVLGGASRLLPSTPKVDQIGAIVSRPGAGPQRFHADAGDTHLQLARLSPRHRLFNVFCPLVDLEEGGDGTMLWPASHLERKRLEYDVYCADTCRSYLLERDERAMAEMAVPACPAGGLLIFDFRLQHRGMPNTSGRERAIAHAVLATGGAFDKLGADASPSLIDAVDALSDDPATRRRQREVVAQQQVESWKLQQANSAA